MDLKNVGLLLLDFQKKSRVSQLKYERETERVNIPKIIKGEILTKKKKKNISEY